jgi:hypothetical protein
MADINVTNEIIDVNVTEEVITVAVDSGAYPLAYPVYSVFGRTGTVVATEGDYSLTQLSDVTLTSPTNGQVLKYNGTNWVNDADNNSVTSVFGRTGVVVATEGDYSFTQLSDVTLTTPTSGQALIYNGTNWVNSTAAASDSLIQLVRNNSGATMTAGTVVYINGALGNKATIAKALATGDATSAQTYGLVQTNIANNADGYVVVIGDVNNLNTSSFTEGQQLYLSGITAGTYTTTKPYAPIHLVYVGIVLRSHPTLGIIGVKIQNGYEMDELHNVAAQSPNNGDILQYVSSTNLWTKTAGSTTNITEGTNLYFTDTRARAAITLTTTGTSGAATYTSGVLNIPQYQSVLTNPVTGTGTTNTLPKFTGASAIGNSNITDDGSLITLGSNTYISSGGLGIGTSTLTNYGIRISKTLTGATIGYGVSVDGTIQSDVITARFYNSTPTTQATAFTLGSLQHFTAGTTTIGAGSSITNQYGFLVLSTAIGATNNYAFSGQLANAANTWNLYNSGSANNYMAGSLGIGRTSLSNISLGIDKNMTGGTAVYGIYNAGTIQSDVTSSASYNVTAVSTVASSFTLTNLYHYLASQSTIGAGSTVTNQHGFNVSSALIGATNNYGFRGSIPAGTNRWNLYMDGTADNYLAGNTGIGVSQGRVSSGPILTTTLTDGGSGYADGTYTDVASTNVVAAGNSALFTVIVSGGIVTSATLTWGGMTYKAGDTLTISNTLLGGTGSGLLITVNTVDSSQLTIVNANGGDISLMRDDTGLTVTENIGSIKFLSNDTSVKASGIAAKIGAYAAGTLGGAYLSFFTSTGSGGVLTEQLRIGNGGQVGIGGAYALTGYGLRVSKDITGAVNSFGIASDGAIQSGVTTSANLFYTSATTQATTFTLTSLNHFAAVQSTFGAGSTVTNQYGFIAGSSLIGATNNYGFFGNIASGIGRYNLFMNGTAENYLAGNLGLGVNASASAGPITSITLTNGGSGYADGTYNNVFFTSTGQSLYAQATFVVSGGIVTSATLLNGGSNYAVGQTLTTANTNLGGTGSGLVVTVAAVDSSVFRIQSGLSPDISLFKYLINSTAGDSLGSIKWEGNDSSGGASGIQAKIGAYSVGTFAGGYLSFFTKSSSTYTSLVEAMRIGSEGNIGISATVLTGYSLKVSKPITGAISSFGIASDGTIQSDVTTAVSNFRSAPSTAAASFTLPSLYHYAAVNGTLGAGSTITDQFGYWVSSSFTNGTNNYAFYSSLAAGTNRWNIYMNGTANNYMAGSLGIGSTSLTNVDLRIGKTITGSTDGYGILIDATIASDVTANAYVFRSLPATAAIAFTLSNLYHFSARQNTIGASSAITNQYGFAVESNLISATNNYGFFGNIASGTNRWNLYMAGTAQNYLAGNTGIGVAAKTTAELSLGAGTTAQAQINLASSTAPTSPQDGDIWFDGTNLKIRVGGVTKTVTIV